MSFIRNYTPGRCKLTCENIQHYTEIQIKVKEQLVLRKAIDINELESEN